MGGGGGSRDGGGGEGGSLGGKGCGEEECEDGGEFQEGGPFEGVEWRVYVPPFDDTTVEGWGAQGKVSLCVCCVGLVGDVVYGALLSWRLTEQQILYE